jgi:hypothetical protein
MSFSGSRSAILAAIPALLLPDGRGNLQLAQNPPQFDSSLKIASTESVKAAGYEFSTLDNLTTTQTLTAAHIGAHVICTPAAAITLTLPTIASLMALGALSGCVTRIQNLSPFAVTIARGVSPDTLNTAGNSLTSIVLQVGDFVDLTFSAPEQWIVSGTGNLQYSGSFGSSLSSSGYQKLPSGLIVNWGSVSITSTGTGVSNAAFNLPLAFPNLFLFAVANFGGTSPPGGCGVAAQPFSKSQVEISLFTPSAQTDGINYIALGF